DLGGGARAAGVERAGLGDLRDLEGVHQFVPEGVAELCVVAPERERDASLQVLGEAEDAVRDEARKDIGLLEVLVRGVDDERNALEGMVAESSLEDGKALLGVGECHARDPLLFGIVVDVDVLAAEHVPLEFAVLDLVLAERLRLGGRARREEHQRERGECQTAGGHRISIFSILSSCTVRSTTSIPSTTRPKIVKSPSRCGCGEWVTKN